MPEYKNDTHDIVTAMELYGGGFIKALAELYWRADDNNQQRILTAFPDYFKKYDELATHKKDHGRLRS